MAKSKKPVSKKNKKSRKKTKPLTGYIFYWTFVVALWIAIIFLGYVACILFTMPQFSKWEIPPRAPNIRIVDCHGTLITNRGATGGKAVSLKEMSPWIPKAVIAIEDRRFYAHGGIDVIGIGRAFASNIMHGHRVQGASTLTQQLAKNLFLSSDRTFDRKIREAALAIWLEYRLDKNRILELYLNRVYFGAGTYGVEAASHRYFNKPSRNITLLEAAMLAGLLKAPSQLSPAKNPEAAFDRSRIVLDAMQKEKMIDEKKYQEILKKPIPKIAFQQSGAENYVADYIINQLPSLIGKINKDIIVETSLDLRLQKVAEKSIRSQLMTFGRNRHVTEGALVSIDKDGAVRAMVGGRNYANSQYNRATEARRQPGSAFKPFVYLAALEQGRTPTSVRNDAPIKIGKWQPRNADRKYMGAVTLTTALSLSLNSVAAQLVMEVGSNAVIDVARRLGIQSRLENNASLALGTSEVSLFELTSAFVPFATGGYKPRIYLIHRITDTDKNILYYLRMKPATAVINPKIAGMMNRMLAQAITTGTAKHANIGRPAAGKTGTSQRFRDAWFIGYTANYITGIWFGNDNAHPMKKVSGGSLPVSAWKAYMTTAEKKKPVRTLPEF